MIKMSHFPPPLSLYFSFFITSSSFYFSPQSQTQMSVSSAHQHHHLCKSTDKNTHPIQ
ncbi:hypothetical protein QJS04_geneDACA000652 [Acorus gramineus]|uniref:Uncharacterized protein n=1 Tax=Acorus gramineus TaxID=55184 RepID=A0AAV9AQ43_ACOGR|nr:hypothetical protein QJS04_geneDACA000652 [Acorus gramineus]